jgi:hypothetical protein
MNPENTHSHTLSVITCILSFLKNFLRFGTFQFVVIEIESSILCMLLSKSLYKLVVHTVKCNYCVKEGLFFEKKKTLMVPYR